MTAAFAPGPAASLRVPDHELLGSIAAGAYGEVWLARNVVGTLRAVKIVRRDQHASAESFEREFKGLQKFEPVSRTHEGLVDILTLGLLPEGAGFYYVMELADDRLESRLQAATASDNATDSKRPDPDRLKAGLQTYSPRTLRADLKSRGALSADEVIALGLKLTAALAHLHAHGLVHRDVKPSNILFIDGEPKLADAGLVAAVDDARSLVGTAGYIAPEGPGTPQADLYALGKVLYEAAFGKDRQEFPALPADVASRPDHARLLELNEIIATACAHDPLQRYASAETIRGDLMLLTEGRSVKRRQAWKHGLKLAARLGPVVAVAAMVAGTWLWSQWLSHPPRSSEKTSRSRSVSTEARQLYQQAKEQDLNTKEGLTRAMDLLSRSVSLNPEYAEAYAALANAYLQASEWYMPPNQAMPLAKREALAALRLDAKCVEGHIILGAVHYLYDWDWTGAEKEFQEAIRLAPNSTYPHNAYATFLRAMGRIVEARREQDISWQLNSASFGSHDLMAQQYYYERDFNQALQACVKAVELGSSHPKEIWFGMGIIFGAMQQFSRATEVMEKEHAREPAPDVLAYLGYFAASSGNKKRAQEILGSLQSVVASYSYVSPYNLAILHAGLGDKDRAFEALAKACEDRPRNLVGFGLTGLKTDPYLDSLRGDPRFAEILKRVGF
jgi:serine/threonine protein kinase